MADTRNIEVSDDLMANAHGGAGASLPLNQYNMGDHVIAKGFETYNGTIIEVKRYDFIKGWLYKIKVNKYKFDHDEEMEIEQWENEIKPILKA